MKKLLAPRKPHSRLLALLLPGLVLVACDNSLNISPTVPTFTEINTNIGAIRTLEISGTLAAAQGSVIKATILFDGQEIEGARSRCQELDGCGELELAGVISAFPGHHTITFKVLRQEAELEDYLASGIVEIFRADLNLPEPAHLDLPPTPASLHAGEGVGFEIDLLD
jgi:hypothetical protein